MRRWPFLVLLLLIVLSLSSIPQPHSTAQTAPTPVNVNAAPAGRQVVQSNRLGVTFVSSGQIAPDPTRYQNALLIGAGWTRWPLYWNAVERSPGQFDWSAYDRLVVNDLRYNLSINAILLNRPPFFAEGESITGLYNPVFADGTDNPGSGKAINPNNPWANFVYQAVQRYKPGGILAQQQGWSPGQGIRLWEVWNEPDLAQFWRGGIDNYARMLKVAYLAAHHADPNTDVMFGGLLFATPDNWLARVLSIYENDPLARSNNWFMDSVAIHSYHYPWRTRFLMEFTKRSLAAYGLNRPIIVNETGISVWNDYPGPVWATNPEQRVRLGTADQAAWYLIQNTAYAWSEGAAFVLFHQLYDDCGDRGGDFPPNNGELCGSGQCFGDAFGLFRNTRQSACYSQHPNPGTARPAAAAFRLMSQVFGPHPFEYVRDSRVEGNTIFEFRRTTTNERILIVWNRRFTPNTAFITASGRSATLYTLARTSTITPQNGSYRIDLKAAVPDGYPDLDPNDISAIAGEPIIIVEPIEGTAPSINATSIVRAEEPSVRITAPPPTPGPIFNPTTIPENDTTPPITFVDPLPEISARTFLISWGAEDDSGIDRYVVWIQTNDDEWTPWLETQRTEGIFTGIPGNTYKFAVWAVDIGGNWSPNIDLQPQAQTVVQ